MAKLNKKMKMKSKSAGGGGNTQAMQFNHALGQHILKNPLIIQALVEKVFFVIFPKLIRPRYLCSSRPSDTQTRCWRLVQELVISQSRCWTRSRRLLPASLTLGWWPSCRRGCREPITSRSYKSWWGTSSRRSCLSLTCVWPMCHIRYPHLWCLSSYFTGHSSGNP